MTPVSPLLQTIPASYVTNYSIPTPNTVPDAIVPGPNQTVWFTEYGAGAVGVFNSTSRTFNSYTIPEPGAIPATLTFNGPSEIWLTDQNPSFPSIWVMNISGSPTFHRFLTNATNSSPVFIISDQQTRNIWFTDTTGNYLGMIDHTTLQMTKFTPPADYSGPVEIAQENGTRYIWASAISGKISRFDTITGTFQGFTPSVSLSYPVGIVVDKGGSVWVSEHGGSAIVEFIPSNSTWRKYPTSQATASPGTGPATLAIDSQGRLWFAEHYANKIGRLDPSADTMEEFGVPFPGAYSLLNSLDGKGNFWFAMAYGNSIGSIPGNATSSLIVRPISTPNSSVVSGQTTSSQFVITNGLSAQISLSLSTTSFFTTNYYTTKSEVSLSTYSLTLGPGENKTVSVMITPDFSLASGIYTAGIVASYSNISSISTFFLRVDASAWYQVEVFFPEILTGAGIALVIVFLLIRRKKPRDASSTTKRAPKVTLAAALVLLFLLLIQETAQGWAKCPGLPPAPGGTTGPDYYGIALDFGSIAFFAIVAYFLIRSRPRHLDPS